MYFHCKNCLNVKTLEDNSWLAVGFTKKGIQVWCETCNRNVINLDFKGQQVGEI